MASSSAKRRDFLKHLGSYVIIISVLFLINLVTSADYPWFLFPAIGWGIGVAFHLASLISLDYLSPRWNKFIRHLGSYVIVIGALFFINLLTGFDYPWFLWPAMGWGVGLAFHLLGTVMGGDKETAETATEESERDKGEIYPAEQAAPQERRPVITSPAKAVSPINPVTQASIDKARAYQAQIEATLKAAPNSRLQDMSAQVAEWVKAIERLARRVDSFQRDSLIHQDLEAVPRAIADLERRLAVENDPALKAQLERTLANRQKQLAALERLQSTMRRAEIQIESTLSSLGTIYSQLLTGQSTDHVADYSRLSAEVDEEVRTLQDQLEALEEVKLGRS